MSSNALSGIFRRQSTVSHTTANGKPEDAEAAFVPPPTPKTINTLKDQLKKGVAQAGALSSIVDLIRNSESIDDRKLFLEHALNFVSKMDEGSLATAAKNKIIELLYNDLAHPSATSIGNQYAWRAADGSGNNIDLPDMGKAGTSYSRSVQQSHPLPADQLPDPGLVFDTLLKRQGFVRHPGGLSSLMFSFAALVIHSVFRTSHMDVNINETSSYVDLSPLYGHNGDVQKKVRAFNGLGYLLPDTFGEDRLLFLPPATCALLVLFNRNHNYIAKRLFEINERGTYKDPGTLTPDRRASQDEDIFQTARLINCGWFGMVVFSDYFSSILGLVRYGNSWSLTPFDEIRKDDHSLFERGKGNVCSVEFNCLYRWHATSSQLDEEWTTGLFHGVFGAEAQFDQITPTDFKMAARKLLTVNPDHSKWEFGGLKRQADGTFKDDDLANVLHRANEEPAGAFRARGVPAIMRLNEIMGIEQSRKWGVCSLNDFRKYLGLKTFTTFLEWNSDPEIADAAEKLYGHIDNLELYVGLQAEEAKPLVEGAGLCPGYTVSRAILSDAIALTRGDRFFTHDFTPFNLTSWGFNDCQRDPKAFGFGSTMGRLFLRTLPNNYTENSVYTFFPFMTPDSMKTHLTKMAVIKQYDINKPAVQPQTYTFSNYDDIINILDSQDFAIPYEERAKRILKGTGFYPIEGAAKQKGVIDALNGSADLIESVGRYFYENTQKLMTENSFTLVGGETFGVDLVKHVIRALPVYWAATDLAGIQLKTKENPGGHYTPQELFDILSDIYSFIFLDIEASKVRVLQYKIQEQIRDLLRLIKTYLGVGNRLTISGIVGTVSSFFSGSKRGEVHHTIMKRLHDLGLSTDELANTVLAVMVASVNLSLGLTNIINLYLGTDKDETLNKLARGKSDPQDFVGFVYEGLRLEPAFRGAFRVATKDQKFSGVSLTQGDRIFVDIGTANLDEKIFANPTTVDTTRAKGSYLLGDGAFKYLGETLTIKIFAEVLRALYAYNNLRRAPGKSGALKRFEEKSHPQYRFAYLDHKQNITPWPTSLTVLYDA